MSLKTLIIILSINIHLLSQTPGETYFPLKVGNEWHFTSNLFPNVETIADTTRIDDITYFVLSTTGLYPTLYLRESNNKIFVRRPNDSAEVLLYNFDADIGESWELIDDFACSFGVEITLLGKDDTINTPAGTYYNCYHFKHWAPCSDAGISDTWFVQGIGKARYREVFFMGIGDFLLTDYEVTSIEQTSVSPNKYWLSQNYPNPFNPSTKIEYTTPPHEGLFVSLKIYDILGSEIATLVNETKTPGTYNVEFDGSELPSGIYFYRLQAGNFTQSKKMILLK